MMGGRWDGTFALALKMMASLDATLPPSRALGIIHGEHEHEYSMLS
jgi:hypothetical protein